MPIALVVQENKRLALEKLPVSAKEYELPSTKSHVSVYIYSVTPIWT